MPTPVLSPGTIAIIVPIIVMVLNGVGVSVDPGVVSQTMTWVINGIGVVAALIAVYRHWREKDKGAISNAQLISSGQVPIVGPGAGVTPSESDRLNAASLVRKAKL